MAAKNINYHDRIQELYDFAYQWLLSHAPGIIVGLIVLIVGIRLIRLIKTRIRAKMSQQEVHSSLQPFFLSVSITGLNILLVIMVLRIMGVQMDMFTTIFGGFTVAIGLALSG